MYNYGYGYGSQDLTAYLIIAVIVLVVIFIIHFFLAKAVSLIAEEKGYDRSTWFAWCFWTGLMGFIAVCAMPDKKLREAQSRNNFLLQKLLAKLDNSNHEKGNPSPTNIPSAHLQNNQAPEKRSTAADNHHEIKEKAMPQSDLQAHISQASSSQQQEKYQKAIELWKNNQKIEAEKILAEIPNWKDATTLLDKLRVEIADDAMKQEDFDTALSYYKKTGRQ